MIMCFYYFFKVRRRYFGICLSWLEYKTYKGLLLTHYLLWRNSYYSLPVFESFTGDGGTTKLNIR